MTFTKRPETISKKEKKNDYELFQNIFIFPSNRRDANINNSESSSYFI